MYNFHSDKERRIEMTHPFKADLHCHSTCSDGTADPCRLIDIALQLDLSALSITDHDTLAAYKTAQPYAYEKKIPLLPGVEFSTTFHNQSVHLLAYAFQLEHPELHSFCNIHHERRLKRFKQIISKLNKEGVAVTLDDVLQLLEGQNYSVLGRPHLAQVLVNKGIVPSIQAAFKTYLGTNLPGYVPSDAFSIEETLELIRAVKGKAILAHPHIYSNRKLITSLLALPLDGIEVYYGRFHPNQEQKWLTIAQEKNWLVTGGSDYHGTVKPHLMLGCSWTGEEVFQTLYQHYLQVNNTDESRDFKTS